MKIDELSKQQIIVIFLKDFIMNKSIILTSNR